MVGDVGLLGTDGPIHINISDTGGTGNVFTLFSDTLDGGVGDDFLFGDFATTETDSGTPSSLSITISGMGPDDTLFEDTIDGGAGDDEIWGELGNDLLTGGSGADTFHFDGSVLLSDVTDMDTITDFSGPGGDGDMVDLDALFDALGGTFTDGDAASNAADRAADVTIASNVLTIGSDADFSITFAGKSDVFADQVGFTAAELAALGIDVGNRISRPPACGGRGFLLPP